MGNKSRPSDSPIFTIGHGNLPIGRFIELVDGAGVELVVDVRSIPYSRFAPQFNKGVLEKSLGTAHIGYRYLGDLLGGRPQGRSKQDILLYDEAVVSELFQEGLKRLLSLSQSGRCAVMCAEKDPNRCHRRHIIARAVVSRGGAVTHILDDGALVSEGSPDLFKSHR